MIELDVVGLELLAEPLSFEEIARLCRRAVASAGVEEGHLAVEFVDAERIAELNERHRGRHGPTDVLSFPIDGAGLLPDAGPLSNAGLLPRAGLLPGGDLLPRAGAAAAPAGRAAGRGPAPRELGDIVICPSHSADLREAIVHGALHLVDMDHETDAGEMLALQAQILQDAASDGPPPPDDPAPERT